MTGKKTTTKTTTPETPTASSVVNWGEVQREIVGIFKDGLKGIFEGAESDLKAFGEDLASVTILAMREGDDKALRELKATARVLVEIHRVRVVKNGWATFDRVVKVGVRTARVMLSATFPILGSIGG